MGVKRIVKRAKKTADKATDAVGGGINTSVNAVEGAIDQSVDWAEGVGKSVARQAVRLSAEAERLAGDAAQELKKYGGDMAKALESAVLNDLLKRLARQIVKDNDSLLKEALKTARAIEQKADEIRGLADQSTKVFTRQVQGDEVGESAMLTAEALNF